MADWKNHTGNTYGVLFPNRAKSCRNETGTQAAQAVTVPFNTSKAGGLELMGTLAGAREGNKSTFIWKSNPDLANLNPDHANLHAVPGQLTSMAKVARHIEVESWPKRAWLDAITGASNGLARQEDDHCSLQTVTIPASGD
jgi:hypothetical protein